MITISLCVIMPEVLRPPARRVKSLVRAARDGLRGFAYLCSSTEISISLSLKASMALP